MKKLLLTLICVSVFSSSAWAQKNWKIELNSMGGMVLGDFSKSDPLNNTSGFSEYSYFADLTAKYYFDDLGVGVKLYSGGFSLDNEDYSEGLASLLGATSDAIFYRQNIGYFSFGTQVGLSYKINFSEQFNLEPSIYGGFFNMVVPADNLVYNDGTSTRTYVSEISGSFGAIFTPGLRLNWQFHEIVGFSLNTEYIYTVVDEVEGDALDYNYLTTTKLEFERKLAPQAFQLGFGVYAVF